MSYIQDIACKALDTARNDIMKARRALVIAAGLLALIHLLTVHPYLTTSREIIDLKGSMAANNALLATLEPEIERLQAAEKRAVKQLKNMLANITQEMIGRFAELRPMVQNALQGNVPDTLPAAEASRSQGGETSAASQMQQVPIGEESGSETAEMPSRIVWAELKPILQAIAADEPDADRRLIDYARKYIVSDAYARAQSAWKDNIRPAYLSTLVNTIETATRTAGEANGLHEEAAEKLRDAAGQLTSQRAAVEAITISHDNMVEDSLGSDWWRTVENKEEYAKAVTDSLGSQLQSIRKTAAGPSVTIQNILALQEELRDRRCHINMLAVMAIWGSIRGCKPSPSNAIVFRPNSFAMPSGSTPGSP